jgi:hypothetical protein
MNFLAPLFFVGLATIAVPIIVHLIQRERKHVQFFPSLMFVQKIPYQSVRRRRIRHWGLLLMRAAAIALLVAAFARPFLPQGAAALAAAGGNRELVILLDHSASMGYADNFQRAKDAAHSAIASIGPTDRATLVLFAENAEEHIRATSDRARLEVAINAANLTAGATRFGPALKLAESILARSGMQRREAILISDFQKTGWTGAEDVRLGENMTLTTTQIGGGNTANVSVPSVSFARLPFQGQERVTLTAGVSNKSGEPVNNVPVVLEIDGHQLESKTVNIAPNAAASVAFAQFTLASAGVRGTVKAGTDSLNADNTFHFVLAPSQKVSVLVVDNGERDSASYFLQRALSIGDAPAFEVEVAPVGRISSSMLDNRSVVILNNTMVPPGIGTDVIKRFVERGGGLFVVLGERSAWPSNNVDVLPGKIGNVVDRTSGRGAVIGNLDYSHPAFEVFKAPRSGDFSAVRVHRSRAFEAAPDARILARYDDGAVAAAERRVGLGRVIVLTTTLDDTWTDLPRKPVYLPLVHQLTKHLARYEPPAAWRNVGASIDLPTVMKSKIDSVVLTPAGERRTVAAADTSFELTEQGVYEIRPANAPSSSGPVERVAANLNPAESDLTPMDPQELVAAVTGKAVQTTAEGEDPNARPTEISAVDAEKQQGLWWYLLVAGLLLLAAETAIANHLSQKERFL